MQKGKVSVMHIYFNILMFLFMNAAPLWIKLLQKLLERYLQLVVFSLRFVHEYSATHAPKQHNESHISRAVFFSCYKTYFWFPCTHNSQWSHEIRMISRTFSIILLCICHKIGRCQLHVCNNSLFYGRLPYNIRLNGVMWIGFHVIRKTNLDFLYQQPTYFFPPFFQMEKSWM